MAEREIRIRISGDASGFQGAVGDASGAADRFGSGLSRGMRNAAIAVGSALAVDRIIDFGSEMLTAGTQVDTWGIKVDTVFGDAANSVRAWADENNEALGMTDEALAGAAAGFGDLLVPLGFTRDRAAEMSTTALDLSGALSAWSGGTASVADVSDRLTAAMLGETDGLKSLGISISAADVQARLAAEGKDQLTGASLQQAQAEATLALILEKSTDAQEAWANGSMDAVKSQNELSATVAELRQGIAVGLTPIIQGFVNVLVDSVIPAVQSIAATWVPRLTQAWADLQPGIQAAGEAIANIARTVFPVLQAAVETVVAAVRNNWPAISEIVTGVMTTVRAAIELAVNVIEVVWSNFGDRILQTATAAWNAISGIVEAALEVIRGVVNVFAGVLTGDWSRAWEGLGQILGGVWSAITTIVQAGLDAIRVVIGVAMDAISLVFRTAWNAIGTVIGTVLSTIGSAIAAAWNAIATVVGTVMSAIGTVISTGWNAIATVVTTVVSAIGTAVSTGWNAIRTTITTVMSAIRTGVTTAWNAIRTVVVTVVTAIRERVVAIFEAIRDRLAAIVGAIRERVTTIFQAMRDTIVNVASAIRDRVVAIFSAIRDRISALIGAARDLASAAFQGMRDTIVAVAQGIRDRVVNIFTAIRDRIAETINAARTLAVGAFNTMLTSIASVVVNIRNRVVDIFTTIRDRLSDIFNRIRDTASNVWGRVRDAIMGPIETVIGGIQRLIDMIRSIPTPDLTPGFDLPGVPFLARGGFVRSPTLAVVGEAGPELVLPLNDQARMRQLLAAAPSALLAAGVGRSGPQSIPSGGSGGVGGDIHIHVTALSEAAARDYAEIIGEELRRLDRSAA